MKNIEFIKKSNDINYIREQLIALQSEPLLKEELAKVEECLVSKDADTRLLVAICGQYSSGKSTLIHALTNDETIKIGQDITTDEVQIYPWNDLLVADTPGIHAGRQDHDKKSMDYIEKADLLIYMITIQGFTREIGANFKKLILSKYQGKTMLLMNKRNQEPAENEIYWRQDIDQFLEDKELAEKLYFSIVDIEDYLVGTRENIPELIQESNFEDFITKINKFTQDKGLYGKLLSRINILDSFLNFYIKDFSKEEENNNFVKRQKRAVSRALSDLKKAISDASLRICQGIRGVSNNLTGLLADETLKEFSVALGNVDHDLENIFNDQILQNKIEYIIETLNQTFEEIDDDANKYFENLRELLDKVPTTQVDEVLDLTKFKSGVTQVGNLATSATREGVTKFMHFFGHKFKPWGATKLTKFVKGFGTFFAGLGAVIDVISFAQDKAHQEELQQNRRELQADFKTIEEGVKKEFDDMLNEDDFLYKKLTALLNSIEEQEREQQALDETKKCLAQKLSVIKHSLDQTSASLTS